ncbi:MAG: pitrilysin family protein [Clostridia bacterium]|nr:pitrilysin family protein [Clostridia bacterium]
MDELFSVDSLPNGIEVHVMCAPKFKTNSITAVLHSDLAAETAAWNAVLSQVARRGTARYPRTSDFMQSLDRLYGASLGAGVSKRGERQLIVFGLEVANGKYLPAGEDLMPEAMVTLRELIFDPALEGGVLRSDYVEQEKENLRRLIESILDEKQAYAFKRCVEEMCRGERYAIPKLGKVEDIAAITPERLFVQHQQVISESPMDIFVVGDVDRAEVLDLMARVFDMNRDPKPVRFARESAKPGAGADERARDPRRIVEAMDVSQGHLVMGYRIGSTYSDSDFPAMVFANGVFGAYTHSKLFQNVRERASLAYFADSSLDQTMGYLWVNAGIDFDALDRAVEIVGEQLSDMQSGVINEKEMENTRRGILRDIQMMRDSSSAMVDFAIMGDVNGVSITPAQLSQAIEAIALQDVVSAAQTIRLDTTYFLRDEGGESHD